MAHVFNDQHIPLELIIAHTVGHLISVILVFRRVVDDNVSSYKCVRYHYYPIYDCLMTRIFKLHMLPFQWSRKIEIM